MDKKQIKIEALLNATKYNGKANPGSVLGQLIAKNPKLKDKAKELIKEIKKIVREVNKLSLKEQKKLLEQENVSLEEKKEKKEKSLPELENNKKVVMRFAPFPSGPLHIGNARTAIINNYYVKKYKGKLLLVIDDTIGSEKKQILKQAYKLIPEGLDFLKINYEKPIIYKSDRLELYYHYAEELIRKDKAYVCFCSSEKLRKDRKNKIECECRKKTIKENLEEWKNMLNNKYKEGEAVLRIKTSMKHKNPAFRDRVIFRISQREHPRTGKKYKVWPLLDFSWAIDDHLLGITHIIRGKELMIETEMENYIWDIFNWKKPIVIHNGLLQIEGIKLSKTKSREEVLSGKYIGWDDPRTFSLQSLKRRGFAPEAIRNFLLRFGLTQTEITAPIDILYSENRKIIDKKANRYFFIENPKKIKIKDAPKKIVKIPLHPDFNRGYRILKTSDEFYIQDKIEKNKVYRFMHLFNFKNNKFISEKMDKNLKAKMIHWLPVNKENVKVSVFMPDASIKKGLAEPSVRNVKIGEVVQFERFGFCKLDEIKNNEYVFWFTHN